MAYLGTRDSGGTARYVLVSEADAAPVPETVPLVDAAAIPTAGLTAFQAIYEHALVAAGDHVMVLGAGGGVGSFAVQLCKHAGATVSAVTSRRSADRAREVGADAVFVAGESLDLPGPVDVLLVFAEVSQDQLAAAAALVRPGGRIVSATTSVTGSLELRAGVTTKNMVAYSSGNDLSRIASIIDSGGFDLGISARLPMGDLARVHARHHAGELHGRVVLLAD
ncbi:hypothetical protein ASH00_16205 [Arthrobacter sp. Soil782]|uniref:zinc-binding dehydrogenase n=1 Tax=Arthrobacter sp. Soil782 TaxID=1736410 RepID=UPI0006FA50A3|nr:zinc-binding dehydrogenase [Arthrobacter sp. Soil782]KRF07086.1 hypothetical protein ASH00_16205 [Arthrobacter sp. Soil782]